MDTQLELYIEESCDTVIDMDNSLFNNGSPLSSPNYKQPPAVNSELVNEHARKDFYLDAFDDGECRRPSSSHKLKVCMNIYMTNNKESGLGCMFLINNGNNCVKFCCRGVMYIIAL